MPKLVLQTGVLGTLDVASDELRLMVDEGRYYTETEVNSALAGKANSSHAHAIADVTNLQTSLDGKAAASHAHTIANVSNLQTTLDGKAAVSHTHDDRYYTETEVDAKTAKTRQTLIESAGAYPAKDTKFGFFDYFGPTDPASLGITLGSNDTWTDTDAVVAENPLTVVSLPADVALTATALADVTGLSFAVLAGVKYRFRFMIAYNSAATGTASYWSINGPAFTTLAYRFQNTQAALQWTISGGSASYNETIGSNNGSLLAGNIAIIEGIIVPSANGTVIARGATKVAGSAITAKVGSHVEIVRLP